MNDKPASESSEVVTSKGIGSSALLGSVVRGRAEWLDLLHKCQNGEATCLYVLKEMEAEMERENARLRAIFPRILESLKSGACSPECSVEFMEMIPDEVRLVIRSLSLPNNRINGTEK